MSRPIDQTNDSRMRLTMDNSEFPKVLIERNKHAPFSVSASKDFVIPRINIPGTSPDNIMAGSFENLAPTAPYAGIQEDLHEADSSGSGSIRSCPTSRWA